MKDLMYREQTRIDTASHMEQARRVAQDLGVYHLAVCQKSHFLGLVDVRQDTPGPTPIGKLDLLSMSIGQNLFVFDVIKLFIDGGLSALPVTSPKGKLLGLLRASDVLQYLSNTLSIKFPGAFISLRFGQNDYNLQEISRIVESNNARILSLHFEPIQPDESLLCTIKIDQKDLRHILATFERFGYTCVAHSSSVKQDDGMSDRYDLLMKYLNI